MSGSSLSSTDKSDMIRTAGEAVTESQETRTTTSTPVAPWAVPRQSSSGSDTHQTPTTVTRKQTMSDIMAQQERERSHPQQSHNSATTSSTPISQAQAQAQAQADMSEESFLRMAMELSLQEMNTDSLTISSVPQQDDEDEELKRVMALSLQEQQHQQPDDITQKRKDADDSVQINVANPDDNSILPAAKNQDEETLMIQKAIEEADRAEAAASLQLVLQLQSEEASDWNEEKPAASQQNQNVRVRTMTAVQFHEQSQQKLEHEKSRRLWGQDDYDECMAETAGDEKEPSDERALGFKMNAIGQQEWSRLDRNTIMGPNREIRTKHDVALKGESNARSLLEQSRSSTDKDPSFQKTRIGDAAFHSFSVKQKRATVKGVAAHGHGRAENMNAQKTRGGAMDETVRLVIAKAINNGIITTCHGVVQEGKEAIVYHAQGPSSSDGDEVRTRDVAVKVFKRIQEFKGRGMYVDGDPRYHKQKGFHNKGHQGLDLWTEKEYRNLIRAHRAGVPVPTPLDQKQNVLFMRFLGEDGWPAPQLREVDLKRGSRKWTTLYCQTMLAVRRLFHCARLVHGDLSEYNILIVPSWQVENADDSSSSNGSELQVVLIDFGQAVEVGHPLSQELLERDLNMVRLFFVKQGISTLPQTRALEFVLAPQLSQTPDLSDGEEEADGESEHHESREAPTEDAASQDKTKGWRRAILSGWDDDANLVQLQTLLYNETQDEK